MTDHTDQDAHRSRLIHKVYEAVLHPEDTGDFVRDWEAYLSAALGPVDPRRNARGIDEALIEDPLLERHFARAHAMLDKMGRGPAGGGPQPSVSDAGRLCSLTPQGHLLDQTPAGRALFGTLSSARGLAAHMTPESGANWHSYLDTASRAPLLDQFRIFALAQGGNLVAYMHRDAQTGDAQIIVRSLSTGWTETLRSVLTTRFSLTNGELALAENLSLHGSLDRTAQLSTRSKNTLRAQMKSVFRKLNVRSQAEAMQSIALLAHFCDTIGFDSAEMRALPQLGRLDHFHIGGIDVPVHFIGPDEGRPVLFVHGMLDGVAVTPRIIEALTRHNLRFIAPVRPGFGAAAPLDAPDLALDQFVQQTKDLADQLSLTNVVILGHMSGAPFAFAAARALGPACSGIVNVAGGVPILNMRQFANMAPRQKAYAYTTRFAPALLPALMRVGVAQIDGMGITGLINDMYEDGSRDKAALTDPNVAAVVMDGYRFAVAQGYRGFEGDAHIVTADWSDLLPENPPPVRLIHGAHDPVVTLASVQDFAQRYGFDLWDLPDAGQLALYDQPDRIIALISDMVIDPVDVSDAEMPENGGDIGGP